MCRPRNSFPSPTLHVHALRPMRHTLHVNTITCIALQAAQGVLPLAAYTPLLCRLLPRLHGAISQSQALTSDLQELWEGLRCGNDLSPVFLSLLLILCPQSACTLDCTRGLIVSSSPLAHAYPQARFLTVLFIFSL